MSWMQKPRLVREAFREASSLDVIIERPASKRAQVEKRLRKLKAAREDEASSNLLDSGDYAKAVKALRAEKADPDRLNNLGYAYAWLAATQPYEPYWGRAIEAFENSARAAEERAKAARKGEKKPWDDRRQRAEHNRDVVREARQRTSP